MPAAYNPCICENGETYFPLERAGQALRRGLISPDGLLKFRRALLKRACTHERVLCDAFYEELAKIAYDKVWGRGYKQTLAEAVADRLAYDLGFGAQAVPAELLQVCVGIVDQAVGRLGSAAKPYDPSRPTRDGKTPSVVSFVRVRALQPALRSIGRGMAHTPLDNLGARDQLSIADHGADDVSVALIHLPIAQTVKILHQARDVEAELAGLLEAVARRALATRNKLSHRNFVRAAIIIGRGVEGDAGHCVILDSRIGATSDAPPVNLGMVLTRSTAWTLYKSKNATVLGGQVRKWVDILLGHASDDPEIVDRARRLLTTALTLRNYAHAILQAATEMITQLGHGDVEERVSRWLGPPQRDRHDGPNGLVEGVTGVGIAHIPFLFGLIDPLERGPGLDRLLGPPTHP